jgi:hypothetical protein
LQRLRRVGAMMGFKGRLAKLEQRSGGAGTLLIIVSGGLPGCDPSDEDIARARVDLRESAKGHFGRERLIKVIGGLPKAAG